MNHKFSIFYVNSKTHEKVTDHQVNIYGIKVFPVPLLRKFNYSFVLFWLVTIS